MGNYQGYLDKQNTLKSNLVLIYAVIWCQCYEAMKAWLHVLTNYKTIHNGNDYVGILKKIKSVCLKFEAQCYPYMAMIEAKK